MTSPRYISRVITSVLRLGVGIVYMCVATLVFAAAGLMLLPFRRARIMVGNLFGHLSGRLWLWLASCEVTPGAAEACRQVGPAIYVSNHTSMLDIFLGIWLAPLGTCGIAKKEILYYPFFGQLYYLSGHLLLDRKNHEKSLASMRSMGELMRRHRVGVWLWPEGTRSRDGRISAFKKGFAHLALASRMPVVPVVITGAHQAIQKGSLRITPTKIGIQVLDPIPTDDWTLETLDARVEEVRQRMIAALPEEQRPLGPSPAVRAAI